MGTNRLIAYLRVSTKSQGQSGLGIEAQRAAVEDYSKQHGAKLEGEYIDEQQLEVVVGIDAGSDHSFPLKETGGMMPDTPPEAVGR